MADAMDHAHFFLSDLHQAPTSPQKVRIFSRGDCRQLPLRSFVRMLLGIALALQHSGRSFFRQTTPSKLSLRRVFITNLCSFPFRNSMARSLLYFKAATWAVEYFGKLSYGSGKQNICPVRIAKFASFGDAYI
jgi:hypothetical protein